MAAARSRSRMRALGYRTGKFSPSGGHAECEREVTHTCCMASAVACPHRWHGPSGDMVSVVALLIGMDFMVAWSQW
eukprot:364076-Chlamydomonas_euryale.AAC.2